MNIENEEHYYENLSYKVSDVTDKKDQIQKQIKAERKKKEILNLKIEVERRHYEETMQTKLDNIYKEKKDLDKEWDKEGGSAGKEIRVEQLRTIIRRLIYNIEGEESD